MRSKVTALLDTSKTIDLHIEPRAVKHTERGPWYIARLHTPDGEVIACSTEPLFAACRELVKRGITGHIRKYRDGMLCTEGDIEQLAGLTVRENDTDGIRIRKYVPFSRQEKPRTAETPSEMRDQPPATKAAGASACTARTEVAHVGV